MCFSDDYDIEIDNDTLAKKTAHLTDFIKGNDHEKIFLSGQSQRIKVKNLIIFLIYYPCT